MLIIKILLSRLKMQSLTLQTTIVAIRSNDSAFILHSQTILNLFSLSLTFKLFLHLIQNIDINLVL